MTLGTRGREFAYTMRLRKLVRTAIQLGHTQLIDLIDKFVGKPSCAAC